MEEPTGESSGDDDLADDVSDEVDIAGLVADIQAAVEAKRARGEYPLGLENDLDAHFNHIVGGEMGGRPATAVPVALEESLERLRSLGGLSSSRIPVESGLPGGSALHGLVKRVVGRQTEGVLQQVEELSVALRAVVIELSEAVRNGEYHHHGDLQGRLDVLSERVSLLEGLPASALGAADLHRRIERLEEAERSRRFTPPYSAAEFEAAFRGSAAELKERYRDLVRRFEGCSPVLDIGCGRGEMLELLGELGVEARGIEMDPQLVAEARQRGLQVSEGEGLAHLGQVPDGTLGGLVLIQVVEHLRPQQVVNLVSLALDKVRPGGRVVIETVNPQSLYVFARAFYLDPTHDRPVHPAYLAFLFQQAGFSQVELEWRSEPPKDESLRPVGDARMDDNLERLNALLFAPQDYALIATR